MERSGRAVCVGGPPSEAHAVRAGSSSEGRQAGAALVEPSLSSPELGITPEATEGRRDRHRAPPRRQEVTLYQRLMAEIREEDRIARERRELVDIIERFQVRPVA